MAEMEKTGETNEVEETSTVDGNPDVNEQSEQVNEAVFADSVDSFDEGQAQTEENTSQTETMSNEQRSENARRRREAQRQQELQAAREQATIEALNGINPYTGEEMKDSADVAEYMAMRKIKAEGGDPVADFSKFQKAKEREQAAEAAQKEARMQWHRKDAEQFAEKYPDVKLDELLKDENFIRFAKGKIGFMPMSQVYEDYTSFASENEKKAQSRAKQILANAKASPGALKSPNVPDSGYFTKEQVQKMSQEEVSKNYDKIRASMTKWK